MESIRIPRALFELGTHRSILGPSAGQVLPRLRLLPLRGVHVRERRARRPAASPPSATRTPPPCTAASSAASTSAHAASASPAPAHAAARALTTHRPPRQREIRQRSVRRQRWVRVRGWRPREAAAQVAHVLGGERGRIDGAEVDAPPDVHSGLQPGRLPLRLLVLSLLGLCQQQDARAVPLAACSQLEV